MPSIRPRDDMGGKFELDFTDIDGRRYRIDTGTTDEKVAKMWLQESERRLSLARLGVIPKVGRMTRDMVAGKSVAEAPKRLRLSLWEKEYTDRCEHDLELAPNSLDAIRWAFASLRGVVGNPYIDSITEDHVRKWKRVLIAEEKSRNTVSIYQRTLKTSFNRAVKWKIIETSPFADVELPSARKRGKTKKSMDFDEVRTILNLVQDREFKRYVQFILYTACRRSEILYLKREDLNLDQRVVYIYAQKPQLHLALPINRALWRVIQEMIENGELPESGYIFRSKSQTGEILDKPWHPTTTTHRFKKLLRLAGLSEDYSLHSCRHTYATFLRSKGVPRDIIQRLLGHTSVQTTDHYDHSDALFFRQFADMVDFEADTSTEEDMKGGEENEST